MAEQKPGYITVEIYDQIYHLAGDNPEHIRHLAARVDSKMRAVATQGRTVDSLRVAVLAALNLADELSEAARTIGADWHSARRRAASLRMLLDEVLEEDGKAPAGEPSQQS
jgi:cell division protein ZapA